MANYYTDMWRQNDQQLFLHTHIQNIQFFLYGWGSDFSIYRTKYSTVLLTHTRNTLSHSYDRLSVLNYDYIEKASLNDNFISFSIIWGPSYSYFTFENCLVESSNLGLFDNSFDKLEFSFIEIPSICIRLCSLLIFWWRRISKPLLLILLSFVNCIA